MSISINMQILADRKWMKISEVEEIASHAVLYFKSTGVYFKFLYQQIFHKKSCFNTD